METLIKIGEFCKIIAIPILLTVILGLFLFASLPAKADEVVTVEPSTLPAIEVVVEEPTLPAIEVEVVVEEPTIQKEVTLVVVLGDDGSVRGAEFQDDGSLTYYELAGEHVAQFKSAIINFLMEVTAKYDAYMANQRVQTEVVETDPKS